MDSPSQSMLQNSAIESSTTKNDDSPHIILINELEANVEQLFHTCAEVIAYLNMTVYNKLDKYVQTMPSASLHKLNDQLYEIDMKCDQLILNHCLHQPDQ
ncbi:hypothetical protein HMI55_000886, partial [Coelomomyces lativittatus]